MRACARVCVWLCLCDCVCMYVCIFKAVGCLLWIFIYWCLWCQKMLSYNHHFGSDIGEFCSGDGNDDDMDICNYNIDIGDKDIEALIFFFVIPLKKTN